MENKPGQYIINISPLLLEVKPIVLAATQIYLKYLGQWCTGVILHGSALKGGYIPGCSDIDFRLYVEPEAFDGHSNLPLDLMISLHRDLAKIDPAPFQYIQGYAFPIEKKSEMVGLIPGAYHILVGTLPVPEATEDLQISAKKALEGLNVSNVFHPQTLLDHGSWRLAQQIRWLCTNIWPMLYQVLTIQQGKGIEIWRLPKPEAMKLLPSESAMAQTLQSFYLAIRAYYSDETSIEDGLRAIQSGLAFLEVVSAWWTENRSQP